MDDKFKLYDEILAKLLQNIQVEEARDGGLYISGYTNTPSANVYMKMVEAEADLTGQSITMLMPFKSYIHFIFSRWKVRKRYRWKYTYQNFYSTVTPLDKIATFIAEYYNQPLSIYEDIYKEYYA